MRLTISPRLEEAIIKGHVRERYTSNGIPNSKIQVFTGYPAVELATCFTDTKGNFLTNPVKTPMYPSVIGFMIIASADGYTNGTESFEIIGTRAGAGQIFQLVLSLALERIGVGIPPGWEIMGTVESTTGKDLYGARVIWQQVTLEGLLWRRHYVPTGVTYIAKTNIYGIYELPLIDPGIYLVFAEATGYIPYGGGATRVHPPWSNKPYTYWMTYHLTKL